jgi:predicted outer membrane lipoprotein
MRFGKMTNKAKDKAIEKIVKELENSSLAACAKAAMVGAGEEIYRRILLNCAAGIIKALPVEWIDDESEAKVSDIIQWTMHKNMIWCSQKTFTKEADDDLISAVWWKEEVYPVGDKKIIQRNSKPVINVDDMEV